jgi:putative membrane protein
MITMKSSLTSVLISCFFVFISSYFAVVIPLGNAFTSISTIFISLFAVPLLYYLVIWIGWKKGTVILIFLGGVSLSVELVAILTGIPYGTFQYSDTLGFHFLDVPLSVPLAYLPILLGSFTLSNHLLRLPTRLQHTLLSAVINTIIDFLIDPAAVKAHFWYWPEGGFYYEVPLINFIGWLGTGFIYSQILYASLQSELKIRKVPLNLTYSLLLILSFWVGYALWNDLAIPASIGCIILCITIIFNLRARERSKNKTSGS